MTTVTVRTKYRQELEVWEPSFEFALSLQKERTRRKRLRNFASVSMSLSEGLQTASVAVAGKKIARDTKVDTKPASDVLAGALARAASQGTIHPLDTLKVRLQTGRATKPGALVRLNGIEDALKVVRKAYRGVLGAASGAGVAVGAYFLVYGMASNAIAKCSELPSGAVAFVAGAIAAAGSSVVKVPIAVCIRSVQAGVYPNALEAAKCIVKSAGYRGLFTGYAPTLLEDVPDMAVKFAVYETLRSSYTRLMGGRPPSSKEDFMMGALAGATAAAATTPFDVVKTHMMCSAASRPTLMRSFNKVISRGPRELFRGVGPRALSSGVNSAIFFCFFEALRTVFVDMKKDAETKQKKQAA